MIKERGNVNNSTLACQIVAVVPNVLSYETVLRALEAGGALREHAIEILDKHEEYERDRIESVKALAKLRALAI